MPSRESETNRESENTFTGSVSQSSDSEDNIPLARLRDAFWSSEDDIPLARLREQQVQEDEEIITETTQDVEMSTGTSKRGRETDRESDSEEILQPGKMRRVEPIDKRGNQRDLKREKSLKTLLQTLADLV